MGYLVIPGLELRIGVGLVLTVAVSNFGSGDSKADVYRYEYPFIIKKISRKIVYICHLFP